MDKKLDTNLIRLALINSFCKETAYPGTWDDKNPSIGQCATATMVANDYLGGEIAKTQLPELPYTHYFNLINDKINDFTKQQFSKKYITKYNIYKNYAIREKNKISGAKINTRYNLLKKEVKTFIDSFFALQHKIDQCERCSFVEHLKGPIVKVGKETKHLFVGEAPAPNGWRKSGRAFYTPQGKLLATGRNFLKMLETLEIKLEDITYTEVVKCMPRERKFLKKAVKNCKPFLLKQLELIKPKIIIPLGSYASIHLTEILGIRNSRPFKELKGNLLKTKDFLVLPLQHPSPANPYGLKFNLPVLKKLVSSKNYQNQIFPNKFIDTIKN
jgi:DNA polymerase